MPWSTSAPRTWNGSSPSPAAPSGGVHRSTSSTASHPASTKPAAGAATGSIDDATWPGVFDTIRAIVAEDGFTELTVLQDKPGHHVISIRDPRTDATIQLGTKIGTTLSISGACFLPEAARRSPDPT
ncbi:MAG: LppA family lipoprotein [Phycicoccus sp.]